MTAKGYFWQDKRSQNVVDSYCKILRLTNSSSWSGRSAGSGRLGALLGLLRLSLAPTDPETLDNLLLGGQLLLGGRGRRSILHRAERWR